MNPCVLKPPCRTLILFKRLIKMFSQMSNYNYLCLTAKTTFKSWSTPGSHLIPIKTLLVWKLPRRVLNLFRTISTLSA
jgi:hypothetical protein